MRALRISTLSSGGAVLSFSGTCTAGDASAEVEVDAEVEDDFKVLELEILVEELGIAVLLE